MAKYEIELDDATALLFSREPYVLEVPTEIDPEMVGKRLADLVERYKNFPAIRRSEDDAAMAFVRATAMERVAQLGGNPSNALYDADRIAAFILGGRL